MVTSKSPKPFLQVARARHVSVLSAEPYQPGATKVPEDRESERQSFLYFRCYVKPDPNDPESVECAKHDKKRLRHLTKAVALGLHKRISSDNYFKGDHALRAQFKALIDWTPCKDPQVVPKVAKWPLYENLTLVTAYTEKESKPRLIGPNSKKAATEAATEAAAEVATQSSHASSTLKRKQPIGQGVPPGEGTVSNEHREGNLPGFAKRIRWFDVADGSKTHVYVVPGGNRVCILEHD